MADLDAIAEQEKSELRFYSDGGILKSKVHSRKHRKKRRISKQQLTAFEQRYSELAQQKALTPEEKRIDYCLVYKEVSEHDLEDKEDKERLHQQELERSKFLELLCKEGFTVQRKQLGDTVYTKLFCPFKRLCREAEKVKIEMPIKDCHTIDSGRGIISRFFDKHFETDNEDDFVSAPFCMNKIDKFEGHENPNTFFRPAVRSLLTLHILVNVNIDTLDDELKPAAPQTDEDNSPQKKKGLSYMLMKKNYTDYFILHEESSRSALRDDSYLPAPPADDGSPDKKRAVPDEEAQVDPDPRKDMDDTWTKLWKFQPLWKIRNYFGERIAFYFAWSGMLCTTLWFPMVFGLIVFFYGIGESVNNSSNNWSNSSSLSESFQNLFGEFKQSFDNEATPYFGLFVCIWGTIFLEVWKRKKAELAYEWDVEQFETNEPDRPSFSGTKSKKDPVTDEWVWYYPFRVQFLKFWFSFSVLIVMIVLVLISVLSVITYRIIITVDFCPNSPATQCLVMGTVLSSVLNAISILILSKFYNMLARKLTDWENHQTQTKYDDALIFKLFAFQFANNYASCIYIAFFQGHSILTGFLNSSEYQDSCDGSCMTKLSFQVFILMLMKPLPKFLKDVGLYWLKKLWNKYPNCCKCLRKCPCCKSGNQVCDISVEAGVRSSDIDPQTHNMLFLKHEHRKPNLGDFTLEEYMEKVIQYGFLMLFGISMPLAPLLALLTNLFDLRVDARRLLWWYRRPVATIAQDIGMWFYILVFINFVGVISSSFILAFTSNWGSTYSNFGKLVIVIGFEHIVFALKYIIAYVIPDTPAPIQLAIRRERYQILKKMEDSEDDVDYSQLYPGGGRGGDRKMLKSGKGRRGMSSQAVLPLKQQGTDDGPYITYFNTKGKTQPGVPGSQVSASDVKPQPKKTAMWDKVEAETSSSPDMIQESAAYKHSY